MTLRQPIPHIGRHQKRLITVTANEVLSHEQMVLNPPDGTVITRQPRDSEIVRRRRRPLRSPRTERAPARESSRRRSHSALVLVLSRRLPRARHSRGWVDFCAGPQPDRLLRSTARRHSQQRARRRGRDTALVRSPVGKARQTTHRPGNPIGFVTPSIIDFVPHHLGDGQYTPTWVLITQLSVRKRNRAGPVHPMCGPVVTLTVRARVGGTVVPPRPRARSPARQLRAVRLRAAPLGVPK